VGSGDDGAGAEPEGESGRVRERRRREIAIHDVGLEHGGKLRVLNTDNYGKE
jgi:hypothetical protein